MDIRNNNNKKIGLLTWHFLDNYGSLYQSYAIYSYLKNLGYNVEFINYREGAVTNVIGKTLRFAKYNIFPFLEKRKTHFYKFRKKHFNQTEIFSNYNDLKNYNFQYDGVICGSDQIWSAKIYNEVYFLEFLDDSIKRYSYAPSSVHDIFSEEQKIFIKNALSKFKYISTREEFGSKLISNICGREVETVLDPVFLLDINDWRKIEEKTNINSKNYLLVSYIGDDEKYEKISKKIQNKYNCDKIINVNIKDIHNFGNEILKDVSPGEFLTLIKNAKIVLTDSYHINLFSIIYNKEFFNIKRFEDDIKDNQNERVREILNKLDLKERLISYHLNEINFAKIDYIAVNEKLKKLKLESINYLNKILEDINN